MPRLRTLKPSFFMNEDLAKLPMAGRLLFQGLWCLADRRGRLEDRPARIKAQVLPYDECDVDALLTALDLYGFIFRYQVADERYLQIVKFEKHQTPHVKEAESTIPAPDEHATKTMPAPPVFCLPSSVSPELEPELEPEPEGRANRAPRTHKPVTDEFREALVTEYGPKMGGEHRARDALEAAENHTAIRKAIDKRRYLRRWLRKDAEEYEAKAKERTNGRAPSRAGGRYGPADGGMGEGGAGGTPGKFVRFRGDLPAGP